MDDLKRDLAAAAIHSEIAEPRSRRQGHHHGPGCTGFYNTNLNQFNVAEPQYRISQIVITPHKDRRFATAKTMMRPMQPKQCASPRC